MYSSKITIYGDKSLNRLDNKYEYIEALICEMRANTEYGEYIFKVMLSADEELRSDMGFCSASDSPSDEESLNWYKKHIRKQLNKLDIITLTFLLNAIEHARN